jgi:hypothetical protein
MSVKVVAAINSMNKRGHSASLFRHQGRMWVKIDQCMLATFDEIEKVVEGVHSFDEMAPGFTERYAKEFGEQ